MVVMSGQYTGFGYSIDRESSVNLSAMATLEQDLKAGFRTNIRST